MRVGWGICPDPFYSTSAAPDSSVPLPSRSNASPALPVSSASPSPATAAPAGLKRPVTVPAVLAAKGTTVPMVMLTAYTTPMARLEDPHVDVLLVGDSLGMVLYGLPSTQQVTVEMMIAHGAAVVRGRTGALVVVDLPFGSYQESPQQAYRTAARILAESGCDAVKLEGGAEMASTVAFLVDRGIPVMGHVGLLPQTTAQYGGFRAQGRTDAQRDRILQDADAIAQAGAFSLVIEATVETVAQAVTKAVPIPTFGIGASVDCDGQVLVIDDLVGLHDGRVAKFVKPFATVHPVISEAVAAYATAVRTRAYPEDAHVYRPSSS